MKREINNTRSEMKMKLKVNILLKDIQKSEVGIFYTWDITEKKYLVNMYKI